MKRSFLFLLFVFCFLTFPLAAQEEGFTITEAELTRLESLLEKLENTKQMQLSQIRNLETELSGALKYQENLTDQLTQAKLSLKKSEKSLAEYEKESIEKIAKKEAKIQKKQKEIEGLKIKNYKLKLTLVIVSSILTLLILGSIGFFILKIKLKLGRF